jgi:hypothetical protein
MTTPSSDNHIVALHQALIPNWTSPAFNKFVDATRALVDELANTTTARDGKEEMMRCDEIFRQICWLEQRFWPEVNGMGEEVDNAQLDRPTNMGPMGAVLNHGMNNNAVNNTQSNNQPINNGPLNAGRTNSNTVNNNNNNNTGNNMNTPVAQMSRQSMTRPMTESQSMNRPMAESQSMNRPMMESQSMSNQAISNSAMSPGDEDTPGNGEGRQSSIFSPSEFED